MDRELPAGSDTSDVATAPTQQELEQIFDGGMDRAITGLFEIGDVQHVAPRLFVFAKVVVKHFTQVPGLLTENWMD